MTTYGDLIHSVEADLYGSFLSRDKETSLSQALNSTDTTFNVVAGSFVDRGYVEIDREIIAVQQVDTSQNAVTVHPWGRAQRGTTAASHAQYARVASNPRFPRSRIATVINEVIRSLYPSLFAISTDETNISNPVVTTYPVPADAEGILAADYHSIGPTKMWVPITRYRMDHNADPTAFPTGKTIDIFQPVQPGRTIRLVYRTAFGTLSADTDTLASANLDERYTDLIRYGACVRMIMPLDAVRLQVDTVEAANRAELTQPIQASQVARAYQALYMQRVQEERARLLRTYPAVQVRQS